jgi:hypothetical protein
MREIIENQRWNNALLNHPKRIYNLHMDINKNSNNKENFIYEKIEKPIRNLQTIKENEKQGEPV